MKTTVHISRPLAARTLCGRDRGDVMYQCSTIERAEKLMRDILCRWNVTRICKTCRRIAEGGDD